MGTSLATPLEQGRLMKLDEWIRVEPVPTGRVAAIDEGVGERHAHRASADDKIVSFERSHHTECHGATELRSRQWYRRPPRTPGVRTRGRETRMSPETFDSDEVFLIVLPGRRSPGTELRRSGHRISRVRPGAPSLLFVPSVNTQSQVAPRARLPSYAAA